MVADVGHLHRNCLWASRKGRLVSGNLEPGETGRHAASKTLPFSSLPTTRAQPRHNSRASESELDVFGVSADLTLFTELPLLKHRGLRCRRASPRGVCGPTELGWSSCKVDRQCPTGSAKLGKIFPPQLRRYLGAGCDSFQVQDI